MGRNTTGDKTFTQPDKPQMVTSVRLLTFLLFTSVSVVATTHLFLCEQFDVVVLQEVHGA